MFAFIIGFVLGFYVACNQEEVKGYYDNFINWCKETYEKLKSDNK